MFIQGDILEATDTSMTAGRHFIIFWSNNHGLSFLGLMLTHSNEKDNIELEASHINEENESGKKYKFQWDDTFVVNQVFYKYDKWGPFTKIGELTTKGLKFINENISDNEPTSFSNYYKNTKQK